MLSMALYNSMLPVCVLVFTLLTSSTHIVQEGTKQI